MDDRQLQWAHQQRRPRGHNVPVGAVLMGLTNSAWFKQQRHLGQLVGALESALPAELAGHLSLEGFRQNVLHLSADSAAHRYELQLRKAELLAAVNQGLKGTFVREIRLSLAGPRAGDPPRES